MIETRIKQIFDYLTLDYDYHTSKEIGEEMELSSKTIRKEINHLNSVIKDKGAIIESKPGVGFIFIIKDDDKFKLFLKNDWYKYAYYQQEDGDKNLRYENILRLFLFSNSYIKQYELAEVFHVSESQINKDIPYIRQILESYGINLISKPYYGMKIEGDEKNIRLAIKNEIGEDPILFEDDKNRDLFIEIQKVIEDIDFGEDYYMPYVSFKNLVIHIYISILRIKQKKYIISSKDFEEKIISSEEFKIANDIVHKLQEKLKIKIPNQELTYIAMHLIAKNTISNQEKLSNEILEISQEIIDEIYKVAKYDFRENLDFYFSLAMHLGPLINRIKYGFDMKNPVLSDIKENQVAFFIATIASNVISNHYNTKLSEDEIGYIALHIMAGMKDNSYQKKDILVVCGSGNSSAQIMKSQLESRFFKQINKLDLTDVSKINKYDLDSYDFIVSSINLDEKTRTPIVNVDILFKQKDISNIQKELKRGGTEEIVKIFNNSVFMRDVNVKDMDEAFEIISNEARKLTELCKSEIISQFKQRETLGSTALVKYVALPHILQQVNTESFSVILIAKKPFIWNGEEVQLIYSLFVGKKPGDMSLYYEKLGNFLVNNKAIAKAINVNNATEFMKIFIKGE
ncbi:BglG family transcription antiterminator [Anaerococcus rubeinfantis]|uniref:BglG family transcription antiterminator n=1 Tax=Anaerococcus rubeinfantis TaxID=1720199 RepID=UPI00073F07A5|nr:BglG family transcription antiterminator [Anaerococcus rubeinfantis]